MDEPLKLGMIIQISSFNHQENKNIKLLTFGCITFNKIKTENIQEMIFMICIPEEVVMQLQNRSKDHLLCIFLQSLQSL